MIFTGFHGLYILLEITCYNYRKYIYFSASKLFNQCKMTPPPPLFMTFPQYLLVTRWVIHRIRIQNSVVGVNIQQGQYSTCRVYQKLEKMYLQSCWKMTPGIFSTTLGLNFQRRKSTQGSIFNVEKWTPGQFSTRFKILRYTGAGSILGQNNTCVHPWKVWRRACPGCPFLYSSVLWALCTMYCIFENCGGGAPI